MAFYDRAGAEREFGLPRFADTVRDDMGNLHEAVNTGKGFVEVVAQRKRPVRATSPHQSQMGDPSNPVPQQQADPSDALP